MLLFTCYILSHIFETPWTVAPQVFCRSGLSEGKTSEWVAIPGSRYWVDILDRGSEPLRALHCRRIIYRVGATRKSQSKCEYLSQKDLITGTAPRPPALQADSGCLFDGGGLGTGYLNILGIWSSGTFTGTLKLPKFPLDVAPQAGAASSWA